MKFTARFCGGRLLYSCCPHRIIDPYPCGSVIVGQSIQGMDKMIVLQTVEVNAIFRSILYVVL